MRLHRVVVEWAGGGIVGRAVNVLHFDATEQEAPPVAAIKAAYTTWGPNLPQTVTCTIPNTGDTIEDTTGELVDVWVGTGGGIVTGGNQGQNAAGVGACIGWNTGGIVNGRKLRGRTFIAPLHAFTYDSDGTLSPSPLAIMRTGADQLQAAGGLAIWHRPTTAGGSDGTSYAVLSNRVRDKVAYLSSRRD